MIYKVVFISLLLTVTVISHFLVTDSKFIQDLSFGDIESIASLFGLLITLFMLKEIRAITTKSKMLGLLPQHVTSLKDLGSKIELILDGWRVKHEPKNIKEFVSAKAILENIDLQLSKNTQKK